jgi:hypothetical protein
MAQLDNSTSPSMIDEHCHPTLNAKLTDLCVVQRVLDWNRITLLNDDDQR